MYGRQDKPIKRTEKPIRKKARGINKKLQKETMDRQ